MIWSSCYIASVDSALLYKWVSISTSVFTPRQIWLLTLNTLLTNLLSQIICSQQIEHVANNNYQECGAMIPKAKIHRSSIEFKTYIQWRFTINLLFLKGSRKTYGCMSYTNICFRTDTWRYMDFSQERSDALSTSVNTITYDSRPESFFQFRQEKKGSLLTWVDLPHGRSWATAVPDCFIVRLKRERTLKGKTTVTWTSRFRGFR